MKTYHLSLIVLCALPACRAQVSSEQQRADWQDVPVAIALKIGTDSAAASSVADVVHGSADTVYVHPDMVLGNDQIRRVATADQPGGGGMVLQIWLTGDGAARLDTVTSAHLGERLAVLIDDELMAAPGIVQRIPPSEDVPLTVAVGLPPAESQQLAEAVSRTWPTSEPSQDQ